MRLWGHEGRWGFLRHNAGMAMILTSENKIEDSITNMRLDWYGKVRVVEVVRAFWGQWGHGEEIWGSKERERDSQEKIWDNDYVKGFGDKRHYEDYKTTGRNMRIYTKYMRFLKQKMR